MSDLAKYEFVGGPRDGEIVEGPDGEEFGDGDVIKIPVAYPERGRVSRCTLLVYTVTGNDLTFQGYE